MQLGWSLLLLLFLPGFDAATSPNDVFVGIKMINLHSITPATGTYAADFYLYFQSQAHAAGAVSECVCPYPEGRDFCSDGCAQCGTRSSTQNQQALDLCRIAPLFTNSVGTIQVQAIKKISPAYLYTNTTNQYRVQGTFLFGGTDIRDWPFETESLNITLEDPNRGLRELSFRPLPEYSGVSPHALSPGWNVARRQAA